MPSFVTAYWDTNGSGGGLVGGSGTWSTSVANWNVNQDGSGDNVVWTNNDGKEANFSSGGGTITLGSNITTGQIALGTLTINGSYNLTIGYSVNDSHITSNVLVISTSDTTFGFQCFFGSLTFNDGFYCNAFRFGVPVYINNSFDVTSTSIGNEFSDSLTLNCDANINGSTLIQDGASLTIETNRTASFNDSLLTYESITCEGLMNINGNLNLQDNGITLSGSGNYNINGDIVSDYSLTKSGIGVLFISGSKSTSFANDIIISDGILKTNSNKIYTNTNFICSGTLNCIGNLTVIGNVTFATGTLRLGI